MRNLVATTMLTLSALTFSASNIPPITSPPPTAGIALKNIDKNIRPQDNFFLHVNGRWLEDHKIPNDKTSIGALYTLIDKAREDVNGIIHGLANNKNLKTGSEAQKVSYLYQSFMNTKRINNLKVKPLIAQFAVIDALKNKTELAEYFAKAQIIGADSPIVHYVHADKKNSKIYALYLWQSGLSLPDRDYYLSNDKRFVELRAGLKTYISNMLTLTKQKNIKSKTDTIFNIEHQLAEIQWSQVDNRDAEKTYNKIEFADLTKFGLTFDYKAFLNALGVKNVTYLIASQPSYLKDFDAIFKKTSLDDWKTYAKWQLLNSFASLLSDNFAQENFAFYGTQLNGQKEQKPRWERAVILVNTHLGELVGKAYVKEFFPEENKRKMQIMIENLRKAFEQSFNTLTWMDAETKEKARKKLNVFVAKIGYPDKWRDYSQVNISQKNLVANVINTQSSYQKREIDKLGKPVERWEWGMSPQTVNAYYSPALNEIVFPAAILQPPFFDIHADDAVNYGGIGAVIGHEMGHGFDDQGAKYDSQGNMKNWWTKKDLRLFGARCKALVKQYNRYEVLNSLHVNGELTLGENIGDLTGVTIAHKAYLLSLNGKDAPIMDGVTGEQRFFIGWAQVWLVKKTDKALRNQIATDVHSPAEFRTNGPLSNTPAFYKAFNVKASDKMYITPEKRVHLW